jgi:hypothetical protein
MIVATFLLLIAQPSPPPVAVTERVSPQVAAERVRACGAGRVTVRDERELQEEVLVAPETGTATKEQLICIDQAAGFGYDVELSPAVQPQFNAIREARASAIFAAEARQWLSAHKLLDRLPKYEPGVTSDAAFTRDVESLCGPQAKGAFQSKYGFHALDPEWVTRQSPKFDPDGVFTCLLNVTSAAGYNLVFIGNEAFGK